MINNLTSNYLRLTSVLQIKEANSGHPGVCLGAAPIAFSIYKNALVNPNDPNFINRDRIVFSAGHASALIYSCLNLFGFNITVDDMKKFRQLGSITTGHPEVNVAPGIDVSTGPLGQGIANAVGLAIAEEYLRNKFAKGNLSPINHYTYCFTGDGCLMEGVAQEAISVAGNLKLNKLIMLYDKNDITIEGKLDIANREDVKAKFLSCGWNVLEVFNGNNVEEIDFAISKAQKSDKPTIIIVKTQIGFGSDLAGSHKVHGKPLNEEQVNILRQNLNYFVPDWKVPEDVVEYVDEIKKQKELQLEKYKLDLDEYKNKFPKLFKEFIELENYSNIDLSSLVSNEEKETYDGRAEGHSVLNLVGELVPNLIGGCADVAPSTQMFFDNSEYFNYLNRVGKNIPYGIREHAMAAISNGISLHKGLIAFCSTFFAFANYMTPAIRLSALSKNPVLYLFTHDSISTGEDGPTHQATEQIATLRAMPDIYTFRPVGRNELLAAYQLFFNKKIPLSILLPRQKYKFIKDDFNKALFGGYIISELKNNIATIVATGTEVEIAIKAQDLLKEKNIFVNVVSMPCVELFEQQTKEYKNKIINKSKPVFCVEASTDNVWYKYATDEETILKLNSFGASGKPEQICTHFGFTAENLAKKVENYFKK
ncbi:MAG: transketolase [Clostridia bacterium]|nr:transketolase [Clostridia bacterium]